MEIVNSFKKYLLLCIPKIVIKYKSKARVYETIESKKLGDQYIAAKQETDNWVTYPKFKKASLIEAGFSDMDAIKMSVNKELIPYEKRNDVIIAERKRVISSYVEQNLYYRTISGQPPIGDDPLYFPDYVYKQYSLDKIPISQINENTIISMEGEGLLDMMLKQYPDKEYIAYMGKRKIDIVTARLADNYSLLYFPLVDNSEIFRRDFITTYEECREYFLNCIYNENLIQRYPKFDNFLSFCILTYTIQRMITGLFKIMVNRDFYDLETTRIFLESYNVPFFKIFTDQQLKLLVKNLNILLMNKSTNRCLFDILNLLGYNNYDIMKYYLVKQHKFDNNGFPYFKYKVETDYDGNEYVVEDKESMYELYFAAVNVKEKNIQSVLSTNLQTEDYSVFVADDEKWVDDKETLQKLLDDDFNYIDTKYMGIRLMYKLQEMMFEISYLSRMLVDKKYETSRVYVSLQKLSEKPISLFDMIVTLACLVAKKNKMKPTLLSTPSKLLTVSGWNFNADLEVIKEDIKSRPDLYDNALCKYLIDIVFTSPGDVNRMFENIQDFDSLITELMNTTTNIKAYHAYKKLYTTLMTTELNNSVYNLPSGETPHTMDEYLKEYNRPLYDVYLNTPVDEISNLIDYVISKMSEMFPSTKHLHGINTPDTYMIEAILNLLRFFKSYTVDIKDFQIIYILDSRHFNMIRLISDLKFSASILQNQNLQLLYSDIIRRIKSKQSIKEYIPLINMILFLGEMTTKSKVNLSDLLKNLSALINPIDNITIIFSDIINNLEGIINTPDLLYLKDKLVKINSTLYGFDKSIISEIINFLSIINIRYSGKITDKLNSIMAKERNKDNIYIISNISYYISTYMEDYLSLLENPNFVITMIQNERLINNFIDNLSNESASIVQNDITKIQEIVRKINSILVNKINLDMISSFNFNPTITLFITLIEGFYLISRAKGYGKEVMTIYDKVLLFTSTSLEDIIKILELPPTMIETLSMIDTLILKNKDFLEKSWELIDMNDNFNVSYNIKNIVKLATKDVRIFKDSISKVSSSNIISNTIKFISTQSSTITELKYFKDYATIEDIIKSLVELYISYDKIVTYDKVSKYNISLEVLEKLYSFYKEEISSNENLSGNDTININNYLIRLSDINIMPSDYVFIDENMKLLNVLEKLIGIVIKDISIQYVISIFLKNIIKFTNKIKLDSTLLVDIDEIRIKHILDIDSIQTMSTHIKFREKLYRLGDDNQIYLW